MLHCPNETREGHPPPHSTRFFADAIVRIGNDWLVGEVVEFLPTPANCGHCMATATDDGVY